MASRLPLSSPGATVEVRVHHDCVEDKRPDRRLVECIHPWTGIPELWTWEPGSPAYQQSFYVQVQNERNLFSHWQHIVVHLTTFWWVWVALTALGNNLFTLRRILSLGTFSVKLWVGLCEAVYRPVPYSVVALDRRRGELMRTPGIIQDFQIQPGNSAGGLSDTSIYDGTQVLHFYRSSSNCQWFTLVQNASIRCTLIVVLLHVYPSASRKSIWVFFEVKLNSY